MNKEYLPYNLAIELKELGFNEMCHYAWCNLGGWNKYKRIEEPITQVLKTDGNLFGTFFNGKNWNEVMNLNTKSNIQCSAPTFSQAFRWFREKYGLRIRNYVFVNMSGGISEGFEVFKYAKDTIDRVAALTYEEAELACLKKLIELVKNK